jgi:ankyrin repeat protein
MSLSQKIMHAIEDKDAAVLKKELWCFDSGIKNQDEANQVVWLCCKRGDADLIAACTYIEDVNEDIELDADHSNSRCLQELLNQSNIPCIATLIAIGANPNPAGWRDPPLCQATFNESFDLVRALVILGAQVNCRNDYGDTPLTIIIEGSDMQIYQIAQCLIEHGADPNMVNGMGDDPLRLSRYHADAGAVSQLLEDHGATKIEGKTAIEQAEDDLALAQCVFLEKVRKNNQ